MEDAGVQRQPVAYRSEECDEHGKSNDADHEEETEANAVGWASTARVRLG